MNILLQTVLDGAASSLMWYLVGFGFAYGVGDNPNPFIGRWEQPLYNTHAIGARTTLSKFTVGILDRLCTIC